MTVTEQPATLASALVAALGQLSDVARAGTAQVEMKTGGRYSYRYAELVDVLAMARPILAANGLALLTPAATDGSTVTVWAQFLHSTGDTLDAGSITFERGTTMQALGSAITYARRYLTMAALCVAGDDDDGAATTNVEPPPKSAERLRAETLRDRITALDTGQRAEFDTWCAAHPDPLTVGALTRDSEWALTVAAALMDIEDGTT